MFKFPGFSEYNALIKSMMKKLTLEPGTPHAIGEAVSSNYEIRTMTPNSSKWFTKNYLNKFEFMFINSPNSKLEHNSYTKCNCFCICCRIIVLVYVTWFVLRVKASKLSPVWKVFKVYCQSKK